MANDNHRSVPAVRVLVVDDFERFRRAIRSILDKHSGLQIVGEASDGLEAVSKAEELQPDLILLDIGLPDLNGDRSRSTNPPTLASIQNSLRESRVRCRRGARSTQPGGVWVRCEDEGRQRSFSPPRKRCLTAGSLSAVDWLRSSRRKLRPSAAIKQQPK